MSKKKESADDMSWVFDSLVDFLRGPIWNIPMINFIEQKSMIFEPGGESQREYRRVHEDYKNLVDFMLGTYMEDIGITPAQFEKACSKSSSRIKSQFHQMLFEQLWAADDFDMFQRMMIRTNIELQLQALELIQQRCGQLPYSFKADGDSSAPEVSDEEKRVLEEVIRRSMLEHQQEEARMDQETRELERTLTETDVERRRLEAERSHEQELIRETLKLTVSDKPGAATPVPAAAPDRTVSAEEIAKRQAYLRQQRDKLLAMKRTERQKLLDSSEKRESSRRPKSSRAARSAFAGKVDAKTLESRKHLAEALRREVVNNNK